MKIKSVHLNNLRNDGHFQFFQFLIAIIRSIGAAVLKDVRAQVDRAYHTLAELVDALSTVVYIQQPALSGIKRLFSCFGFVIVIE